MNGQNEPTLMSDWRGILCTIVIVAGMVMTICVSGALIMQAIP